MRPIIVATVWPSRAGRHPTETVLAYPFPLLQHLPFRMHLSDVTRKRKVRGLSTIRLRVACL